MNDLLRKESIMIVDDEPENLNVLAGMLAEGSWNVYAFPRGDLALKAASEDPPDLVLMDIRMPGMDGYETCRLFKQDERLKDIPVIFLSALSEPQDKIEAFRAGGADYVTKPFYAEEVLARVRAQLEVYRYRLHLEELVRQRTEQLQEAHRRLEIWDGAKNNWLNALSHEMRTPLTGIIGTAEVLLSEIEPDSELAELRCCYELSVQRINKLIDDAMLLTQIDVAARDFTIGSVGMQELLQDAVLQVQRDFPDIRFSVEPESQTLRIEAEAKLLHKALEDLLFAAQCCVLDGESIHIQTAAGNGVLVVSMITDGQPLPQQALNSFFDVGGQRTVLKGSGDLGLGPALACRIIQLFNGNVSVSNGRGKGIVIEITLPLSL
jgi:two-component system, sensor histidine kinase and response regulator